MYIRTGRFGLTYQALDMLEDTYVAIKECMTYGKAYRKEGMRNVIFLNDNLKEMQFELYKNEAAILKELSELTEVVSFKDFLCENNTCYIIMEYFEGITLEEMVKNSDETRLHSYIKLLKPVIECLDLIHERGVIHRAICPENILISSNQELRIIDFGSAVDFDCLLYLPT